MSLVITSVERYTHVVVIRSSLCCVQVSNRVRVREAGVLLVPRQSDGLLGEGANRFGVKVGKSTDGDDEVANNGNQG